MSQSKEAFDNLDGLSVAFQLLTDFRPLSWQSRLYNEYFHEGEIPGAVDVPTGLGKTAIMALWLIARANGATLPRRLVYVVDRRAVVDQASDFAVKLRNNLDKLEAAGLKRALGLEGRSLPISTLRGQHVDNREWLEDPASPAIVVGTVDMIGSRLLFGGYGVSPKMRPYQAGMLGADTLVMLDEAHLVPPFESLLDAVAGGGHTFGPNSDDDSKLVPPFRLLSLSATGRKRNGTRFALEAQDYNDREVVKRLNAIKCLTLIPLTKEKNLSDDLAAKAWELSEKGNKPIRCLIYCDSREMAKDTQNSLNTLVNSSKKSKESQKVFPELFVGARRVFEREMAAMQLKTMGFLAGSNVTFTKPVFLIATSAGEVGVDLDADHMVCDLVTWERMVQRLGRVNRRGAGTAQVIVVDCGEPTPKKADELTAEERAKLTQYQAIKALLAKLPRKDGSFSASPGLLSQLGSSAANDPALTELIFAASTPPPLRPALTRALVDAWSMTSLEEHTGRPEIAPWLRGWVNDRPQTAVLWRTHLPVRVQESQPKKTELEAFFEAAAPHASELLETETFHVVKWLMDRVAKLVGTSELGGISNKGTTEEQASHDAVDDDEPLLDSSLPENRFESDEKDRDIHEEHAESSSRQFKRDDIVGFILSSNGKCKRALQFGHIPPAQKKLSEADKKKQRQLTQDLSESTLVMLDSFGGLQDGLLDPDSKLASPTADMGSNWTLSAAAASERTTAKAPESPLVRFRVRDLSSEPISKASDDWRENLRFDLARTAEGEATRWLVVEKWRANSANEDDRSAGPPQSLADHQTCAKEKAHELAQTLRLPQTHADMLAIAARLHDEGKKAKLWQDAFNAKHDGRPYAKTRGPINFSLLNRYRHEFGSLPHAEQDIELKALPKDLQDLALHLIAAHHGFARPTIGTDGCEDAPPTVLEARAREVALRFARLQKCWGPWGLAWWEALLRAADQQASRDNEDIGKRKVGKNI